MFIESISINNFRAYKGLCQASFMRSDKNVFLIAGNNGFGKTTFLTALVWCLYGKLMGEVDDKFRKEILDNQGYKGFAKSNLNKSTLLELELLQLSAEERKEIAKKGYVDKFEDTCNLSQYYVEIVISDVFIPSIPCSSIAIKRTYDYLLDAESVDVLIDGQINELAREVGYDIFINDFILSKDIAKFFLFDAEKIVTLAEVKSIEEKRKLSMAYSEVLGIKKYEDIKRNLENLRIKYRKNSCSETPSSSKLRLDKLLTEIGQTEDRISQIQQEISTIDRESQSLKTEREQLQEKLIREGNAMSVDELNKQKDLLAALKEKDIALKTKLKDMLDIAPFAISGNLLTRLKKQVDVEKQSKQVLSNSEAINAALLKTHDNIISEIDDIDISINQMEVLKSIIDDVFHENFVSNSLEASNNTAKSLLDYSISEENEFQALYDKIIYSYNALFRQLVKDIKNNSLFLVKTQKKINAVENTDFSTDIKAARDRKNAVDLKLQQLEKDARSLSEQLGVLTKELAVKKKQQTEVLKYIRVDEKDKEKDIIAERLILELNSFLYGLKNKRKNSLANKIKSEIDTLMHKDDFIHNVRIEIKEDIIDIILLDSKDEEISKDKLSKGEQQLYATAILKALVDESGISFPVFIDSPLQKFDAIHAHNIITKFYPSVAKQVVIFPLLGKELSKEEYGALLPYVSGAYIIHNDNGRSFLAASNPDIIFNDFDFS